MEFAQINRKDNMDQLGTIVDVLGTSDLHAYISKYNIDKTPEIRKVIAKYTLRGRGPPQEWEDLVRKHLLLHDQQRGGGAGRRHRRSQPPPREDVNAAEDDEGDSSRSSMLLQSLWPSPDGIDLMSKLLIYDHNQRLTAKQAMQHKFFDSVRDRVEEEVRYFNNYRLPPTTSSSSSSADDEKATKVSTISSKATAATSTTASINIATAKRGGGSRSSRGRK